MPDDFVSDPQKNETPVLNRFFYLLGARGIREVLQTFFFILLARMSTTTYGEFMFAMGFAAILLISTEFGLNQFLVPRMTRDSEAWDKELLHVLVIKGVLFASVFLASVWFISRQGYAAGLRGIVLAFSLATGLEAFANSFFVILQVRGLQKREGVISSIAAAGGYSYALITFLMGYPPVAIALYRLIEAGISLCLGILASGWRPRRFPHSRIWKGISEILPSVFVFGFIEVAAVGYNKINLFFLQHYGGTEAVAQYSATWQIVDGICNLVSGLLLQGVFYPLFAGLWSREKGKAVRLGQEAARWLGITALACVYVLYVESDRLIFLVYGPQYGEAARLQQVLAFTPVFAFFHNVAAFILLSMGMEKRVLGYCLGGLGLNILLCVGLVPGTPLLGAGLAILITKAGLALMTVSCCQFRVRLIAAKPVFQLLVSGLLAGILSIPGKELLGREAGEMLGLLPVLVLAWRWRRGKRKPFRAEL